MTPGDCPYERTTIKFGRRLKTCCTVRKPEIWVECREWDKCHWDGRDIEPDAIEEDPDECEPEPEESEQEPTDSESEQMTLW